MFSELEWLAEQLGMDLQSALKELVGMTLDALPVEERRGPQPVRRTDWPRRRGLGAQGQELLLGLNDGQLRVVDAFASRHQASRGEVIEAVARLTLPGLQIQGICRQGKAAQI